MDSLTLFRIAIIVCGLWGLSACGGGGGGSGGNTTPPSTETPPANTAPVANAGGSQSVNIVGAITLNGAQSSDANNDNLSYLWSIIERPTGSVANLSATNIANPNFTPDVNGTYRFGLVVNDGTINSAQSIVEITANIPALNNTAPLANAGLDQNINTGTLVTLDGSNSTDADSDTLTYTWALTGIPIGSTAQLNDVTSSAPTFSADLSGTYTATLVVNDGITNSTVDTVSVIATVANAAPVANAGVDQNNIDGQTITLTGTASTDANNDTLTYLWTVVSIPGTSSASLNDNTAAEPEFVADVVGDYVFSLIVNDGTVNSSSDSITVTITASNAAPIASAGSNLNVDTLSLATLDGSGSSDANNDALSYQWTMTSQPPASTASISNANTVMPTLIPDVDGIYVLQLIVNDGIVNSVADAVSINASTPNSAPLANAGPDQAVNTGSVVSLSAAASSDADNDTLTYAWTLSSVPSGSSASLSSASGVSPSFTADVDGSYTATLIVNDGTEDSVADNVTVTASTPNSAPVANAGPDQSVNTGSAVSLSAAASSDADNDTLTYEWELSNVPNGSNASLSSVSSVSPSFTADVDGSYTATLVVNDGIEDSVADSVTVTASTPNSAPVANAGLVQNVTTGTVVQLNGSNSSDANGDALSYLWSIVLPSGSTAALSDTSSVNPTFTVDVAGSYEVSLVVNDGALNSASNSVTITATLANAAPVANAGPDQNSIDGLLITLNGADSNDANNDQLTYLWSIISTPAQSSAALSSTTSVNPQFTADEVGDYVFGLVVNDGLISSAQDTITVTITESNAEPVANAGIDQNVSTGSLVTLSASASTDANGDALTYSWSISNAPTGSNATLSDTSIETPTIIPDVDGTYVIQLIVNDGTVSSMSDTVSLTAQTANSAPVANAGADQRVLVGTTVSLNGTASSDADNDALTYAWSFVTRPATSNATLDNANIVNPQFTGDVAGDYVVNLVVNDGTANSVVDSISIEVIQPTITLEQLSRGVNPTYQDVAFPSINREITLVGNVNSAALPSFFTIDRFKFTTVGQSYTISNVRVEASVQNFSANIIDSQTGNSLAENTVIPADSEFEFDFIAELTEGDTVRLRFTVDIVETNERLQIIYDYTTISF